MVETLLESLRSDQRLAEWLRELEVDDSPRVAVSLPDADELPGVLLDLAVPHEDINEVVALRARMTGDTEVWWLLERFVQTLATHVGTIGRWPRTPTLPDSWGAVGRWFYLYTFLGLLPYTADYHRQRDIPADVSRRTLADIGRNVAVYRRRHGVGGMNAPWWLLIHLRGELYQLGRLQFQRAALGNRTGTSVADTGLPYGTGSPALGTDQLPLDQLPQRSTLERAVVAHLRSGGHWHREVPGEELTCQCQGVIAGRHAERAVKVRDMQANLGHGWFEL